MFNPSREGIAPDQCMLEKAYRDKLLEMHDIIFNHLIALSNMPIGRLGASMSTIEKDVYIKQLEEKYNPATVRNLMCKNLISVSPDGNLHDCDFWQMLNIYVQDGCKTVADWDYEKLKNSHKQFLFYALPERAPVAVELLRNRQKLSVFHCAIR